MSGVAAGAAGAAGILTNMSLINLLVIVGVTIVGAFVAIFSFALLIPLDSIPAVTGVSIIMAVSYGLSFVIWSAVMIYYSQNPDNLIWLNTCLMFLVILPATISATAMNVTTIQNTRNLLAGQITT
jgi:hypothetical protein